MVDKLTVHELCKITQRRMKEQELQAYDDASIFVGVF